MEQVSYPTPPMPTWLWNITTRRGITPDPEFQIKFLKPNKEVHWVSNKGPQTWVLQCPFDEILIGGRRGGSKSSAICPWMAMGDPFLAEDDPAKYSFLNEPSFRGLILRQEYQELEEFIDEAEDFFRVFGGKASGKPRVIEFPSAGKKTGGAKLYFRHLGDKEAYNSVRGWGLTRIAIEELTLIPEESWYTKLFGSLRGKKQVRVHNGKTFPALRAQILATTNPDGPGQMWVRNRFVKVYGTKGLIPANTPMRNPISGMTKIFIPMRREDNPYLRDNKQYESMLMEQDPVTRRQWMEGDWECGAGTYFVDYRPDGPSGEEEKRAYPWAQHVVTKPYPVLKPWWYRLGGLDWGFQHNSVFLKACRNEADKRIHVYGEKVVRQVGSYELGVMLANWWVKELEELPDHQVTIYMSPDAFSKTDASKTKAEQMAMGIREVLGPYGAVLMRYTDDERAAAERNPAYARRLFESRRAESDGKMCVVLKPANNDRVAGWSYITELLRWRPVRTETQDELRDRLQKTFADRGVEAYEKELAQVRFSGPEVLPRLQIWDCCPQVDRFMKAAQHDEEPRSEDVKKFNAEDGRGGDDAGDSLRYLLFGYKEIESKIPKSYWVNERTSGILDEYTESFGQPLTDPTRLAMIAMRQQQLYEREHPSQSMAGFSLPRASSGRHRSIQ